MKRSANYEFAIHSMELTSPYKTPLEEFRYTVPNERVTKECNLINMVDDNLAGLGKENRINNTEEQKKKNCFKVINKALKDYLLRLPGTYSFKQNTRRKFFKWLTDLRLLFNLSEDEAVISDEIKDHMMDEDTAIALVKELQSREGIAVEDLSDKLKITPRAVQKDLRKLDPSLYKGPELDGNASYVPFRIGGQPVHLHITSRTEANEKQRKYQTVNTMHPIVLQQNLMEAGTLLYSLFINACEKGSEISRFIAMDIWFQLTDYAKEKIRRNFFEPIEDYQFSDFLDELEDATPTGHSLRYMTERDMLKDNRFDPNSPFEKLIMAYKGERYCSLDIAKSEGGEIIRLYHQRVYFLNHDGDYEAKADDGTSFFFHKDELVDIDLL